MSWLFHAFALLRAVNWEPWSIIYAVADDGPAIVFAGFLDVKFIATLRAMLVCPHIAGDRMDIDSLRITMPIAVNFWQGISTTDKRVVAGHAAVVMQAYYGAAMVCRSCAGCASRLPEGGAWRSPTVINK